MENRIESSERVLMSQKLSWLYLLGIFSPMSPATQIAFSHLNKYPKTIKQTKEFLRKKWFEDDEIEDAILELQQLKVLDDVLYAKMYLNSELTQKWKPRIVVHQKLYQKWIEVEKINQLFHEHEQEYSKWIHSTLQKLWNQKKKDDSTQKRIQRMMWRGYSYAEVKEVVSDDNDAIQ